MITEPFEHIFDWQALLNEVIFKFCLFPAVLDVISVGTFTMSHEELKKGAPGWGWANIIISATLHYTDAWYQIHVSAVKVCLISFTCSKHLILCQNLLLNVPNFQQAAVDAPTRNMALEWGTDYDIRLNGIAPGPIGDAPGLSKLFPK